MSSGDSRGYSSCMCKAYVIVKHEFLGWHGKSVAGYDPLIVRNVKTDHIYYDINILQVLPIVELQS